jgi:asparagine synthase (glutamine-hydrolysing)
MCGFVGYKVEAPKTLHSDISISQAIETIHHRGPDHTGFWQNDNGSIALAHKRLAIIDTSSKGNQPFIYNNEDLVLVFNGEIYNYLDLKKELSDLGATFNSDSDTEVVVAGYSIWGVDIFSKLAGMFSLALVDNKLNKVILSRDIAGEKPLFYFHNDRSIFFGSEIKPLLALNISSKKIDTQSLKSLFSNGFSPPSKTIFSDILKLDAAHYLEFDCNSGGVDIKQYWNLKDKINKIDPSKLNDNLDNLSKKLESLLESAVISQLVSDVPIGMLLSGGVDSSLLVSLASRSSKNLKTFNVAFNDYDAFDESHHARLIAKTYDCNHHEIEASKIDPIMFESLAEYFDDPIFDTSMIPTFLLSEAVSKHCKVAIGGDGGDELFGGYPHYDKLLRIRNNSHYFPFFLRSQISSFFQFILPIGFKGKKTLEFYGTDLYTDYPNIAEFYNQDDLKNIFNTSKISSEGSEIPTPFNRQYIKDLVANATFEDFSNYLKGDLLVKVDRASMANSLEVRSPFLDRKVIEFAFLEVPSALKATSSSRKILLKKLASRLLPSEFNCQRKQGFSIPINKLLSDPIWSDFFHQKVADADPAIFNKEYIFKLIKSFGQYKNNGERIAALIFFMCWIERHEANF